MTNPTASDPIGPGHIMAPNDSPETSKDRTTIQHDEHIARLTQEIEDLRSELTRVRDVTNLSITLQSPLPEPRSTTPNPSRFPSLDSPVPEHFPPQQPPPTNNNLPPTIPANPPNLLPIYTPAQKENVVLNGSIVPIRKVENDILSAFGAPILTTQRQAAIEVTVTTSYMPLYNTETLTIWDAEPEETLKNWTYTSFVVRRESW
uniref:Uncharacterized protein n=1 Tax=Solanum tuberosum TaxID=4113 RepID=M1CY24_SOLTU